MMVRTVAAVRAVRAVREVVGEEGKDADREVGMQSEQEVSLVVL